MNKEYKKWKEEKKKYPATDAKIDDKIKINLRREAKKFKRLKRRNKGYREHDVVGSEQEVFTPGRKKVKSSYKLRDLFG